MKIQNGPAVSVVFRMDVKNGKMECHTNLECMKMLFTTLIGITDGKVKQSAFVHFVAVLSQMRLGQS